MFLEVLRTISIVILIFFLIWTTYIVIKSLISFKKTKRLFKSSFNSTWKTLFSSFLVILFFGVSFSIIIGTTSSVQRIENSLNELLVENNLHMSYVELNNIEFKESESGKFFNKYEYLKTNIDENAEEIQNKGEIKTVQEYLYYYFKFNPSILGYYCYLYFSKAISRLTFNEQYKYLNWKYELSYYYTLNNVNWGYKYISINDYNVIKMLIDSLYYNDTQELSTYKLNSYDQPNLTQSSFSQNNGDSYFLIDDFEVVDSEHGLGVNELLLDQKSNDYDIVCGVGADWASKNNIKVGDIILLPQPYGTDIKAKVGFTFRAPQYVYPSFDISKIIPNTNNQTYVLMSSIDFLNYFGNNSKAISWFGFNNIYGDINSYDDFNSKFVTNKTKEYINLINISTSQIFENSTMYSFNNPTNYNSIGIMTVYLQIGLMKVISLALLIIFLIITIGIISVLIKKKIQSNRTQLGTLKALGWNYNDISLSFISFPITLIIIGSIIAIIFSIFIQSIWIASWSSHFLINSGSFTLGIREFFIVFGIPIIIFISISYLIAKKILKKSTVDLIKNIDYNKPNIFIKTLSPLTSKFKNFERSYQTKNILRGLGKSFIIFSSVLFSFLIISFSISGVNLINNSVIAVVDSIKAQNIYLINNESDLEYINGESTNLEEQFNTYYMFTYLIDYDDVENLETPEEVWQYSSNYIKFNGNTEIERAEEMDEIFGSYIINESFNQNKEMIPWQAFEILNYAITQVYLGEPTEGFEETELSTSGLTFNDYLNIYNQYIYYYNLNNQMKEDNEEVIQPNILINTIIYDNEFYPYINETISWSKYEDEQTGDEINSLNDLEFHKGQKIEKTVTKIGEDEWIVDNEYQPEEKVSQFLEENKVYSSEIDNYLISYYEETDRSEGYEINDITYYDVTYYNFIRNSYIKSNKYSKQWISSFNESQNINSSIKFDENVSNQLDNYSPKEVQVKYEDNGQIIEESVDTIPIIIDDNNANRLNLEEGEIIKTDYYDLEEKLNNNLSISDSSNDGIAFEIVDIFDYAIPIGAITLNKYLLNSINELKPYAFIQSNNSQREFYTTTSYVYDDNTSLNDDFKTGYKSVYSSIISKDVYTEQLLVLTSSIKTIFFLFAFFAGLIALTLIFISINEIAENSIKEISILKANGIKNKKATMLILSPYLLIILIALIIAIPINILFFIYLSNVINGFLGGITINLGLNLIQWIFLISIIGILFLIIFWIVYRNLLKKATIKGLT